MARRTLRAIRLLWPSAKRPAACYKGAMNTMPPLDAHIRDRARNHASELLMTRPEEAETFLLRALETLRSEGLAPALIADLEQDLAEIQLRNPQR